MLVVAACTSAALSICFHKTFYWNSIAGGRSGEVATAGPGSTRQEEGDSAGELMRGIRIRCIKLAILLGSLVPILYIIVRAMTQILVYESISHPLYKNCLSHRRRRARRTPATATFCSTSAWGSCVSAPS